MTMLAREGAKRLQILNLGLGASVNMTSGFNRTRLVSPLEPQV